MRCFEAGALATGAQMVVEALGPPYSEFVHDVELAAAYRRNAEALGRSFAEGPRTAAASTDMANVSLLMPTIHPTVGLPSLPAVNHQPEFAAHCITPVADAAMVEAAIALAWTAIDAASEGPLRARLLAASDTTYGERTSYPWRFD
jgi:metal-dependent amidase/aminoacylase/carboxypeptidase family protein